MFTRIPVWREAIGQVLARHNLPPGKIGATFFGTCPVFTVDSPRKKLIVKFYPPMVAGDWKVESSALDAIRKHGKPLVPRIIARGIMHDRSDWRYLVLDPVPGRLVRDVWKRMPRRDRLVVLVSAGRMLDELHKIRPPRGVPRLEISELAGRALREYRMAGVFSVTLIRDMRKRFQEQLKIISRARPVLLHADLNEDHVVVARSGGRWRVTGLIDFGDARTGNPMYEWMPAWYGLLGRDPRYFRAFARACHPGLQVTPAWREQVAVHVLVHRFGPQTIIRAMKQLHIRPRSLDWAGLRDLVVPPGLEQVCR